MAKSREELMEVRKQMIGQMEQKLHETWSSEEDSCSTIIVLRIG